MPDAAFGLPVAPVVEQAHIVRRGEWLYAIARAHRMSLATLARLNHLRAPYKIEAGQRLLVLASLSGPQKVASNPPGIAPPTAPSPKPVAPAKVPSVTVDHPASPAQTAPAPPTGRSYTINLGLRDGQRYLGDIESTIAPDGSVSVSAAELLDLLRPVLDPPSFAKLSAVLAGRTIVALTELGDSGVTASFDAVRLQVQVDVPATSRPSQSLAVADLDQTVIGDLARPEPFSGYLNLRGSLDFVETGSSTGLQDPLLLLDGAVRAHGLVLETEAQYAPNQSVPFTRQGSRLVYDDQGDLMRWTAGDLQIDTEGFQGSSDMVGLSVVRLYDELAPQQNVRPRGNRSFTLTRASTVLTYVNGQQVQQVRLDPGTYDVNNFPFVEGANDVHLQISDDAGTRETIDFSLFFDRSLLKPGLTEFGAFAGLSSSLVNGDVRYDNLKPAFTGFVRHGLFDELTLGVNFQADRRVQMGGIEGLWGSPLGTIGFDIAGSNDRLAGSGYAINIGFNRLIQTPGDFNSQTISATFEMRSRYFTLMQDSDFTNSLALPNNPFEYEASITYGRSFGEYTFAEIDGRYSKARDTGDEIGTVRGTLGYEVTRDANVNLSLQYASGGFQKGVSAGIQLTYRFSEDSNLRADIESANNVRRLSYQETHGRGADAWSLAGDLEDTPGALAFNGEADYTGNRAEVGVTQTTSYDFHGNNVSDARAAVHAGTSIAFAGGSVALGRPIFDSFAIFEPHPTLMGAPIVVEPNPEGDLARSGSLGPALLNDMGSYSLRTVTFDVPTAPPGYDIGSGSLRAVPPYRSGYRVVVGSDYSIVVIGRLLDADGAPIPLLAGKATELAPNGRSIVLFTSRDGRFGAQGLRPGKWRIELPASPPVTYVIDVPAAKGSLVRVGDLKPSSEGGL